MPAEVRTLQLAERFGLSPLQIEDEDADRWLRYLQVLGVEGEVRALGHGVADDEPIVREGDA